MPKTNRLWTVDMRVAERMGHERQRAEKAGGVEYGQKHVKPSALEREAPHSAGARFQMLGLDAQGQGEVTPEGRQRMLDYIRKHGGA